MNTNDLKPPSALALKLGVKCIAFGPPGSGKCLAPGTSLLMYDGSFKNVEDVRVNNLLMGPDSKPRRVLTLSSGWDNMYEVKPTKGDSFSCNHEHVLSLRISGTERIVNIPLYDFLNKAPDFQRRAKAWRTGVDFPFIETPFDPYFLGVWLGDGSTDELAINNPDPEILQYLKEFSPQYDLRIQEYKPGSKCPRLRLSNGHRGPGINKLKDIFREWNLFNNKHIPTIFKVNARAVRLKVLAGLLDTDGHLSGNGYDFISKLENLADDVCFLARSLGLAAYKAPCEKYCQTGNGGTYYRVSINGNTNIIPVKIERKKARERRQIKNVLNTGIKIIPKEYGEYFGFTIDGDGLFLLSDFTVTHNTPIASTAPNPVMCITEPGMLSMRKSTLTACAFDAYTAKRIDEFFEWFFKSTETKKFDTLVLDSASQMHEIYVKSATEGTSSSGKKVHGMAAYGEANSAVLDILTKLYYMPNKHVFIICKQEVYSDQGTIIKRPYFAGKELPVRVPHLFDEILHIAQVPIPGYGIQTAIRCKASFDIMARDRSGNLNELEPPDLGALFTKAML